MAKILGVYRIGYKNSQNNTEKKLDLLVMENLFYGRKMAQVGQKAQTELLQYFSRVSIRPDTPQI